MPDVRQLTDADADDILSVINAAAARYRGKIPPAADTDPYMPMTALDSEREETSFYGVDRDGLAGVIGVQAAGAVTLIRHLYVRPDVQRQGLGSELLAAGLEAAESETVLVGTWAAAEWAIAFYERHGFALVDNPDELLETYWSVPGHQRDASVVLRYEKSA